jgi:hypothetical protein
MDRSSILDLSVVDVAELLRREARERGCETPARPPNGEERVAAAECDCCDDDCIDCD